MVTKSSEKDDQPVPSDRSRENITPALIALASGIIAGNTFFVFSRIFRCSGSSCEAWKVTELSLSLMLLIVGFFVVITGCAAMRGKIGYGPVLVSVTAAVISALLAILDQTIHSPTTVTINNIVNNLDELVDNANFDEISHSRLHYSEALYHWGWVVLLLLPGLLLPIAGGSRKERTRNAVSLMTVTFGVALLCGIIGFLLEGILRSVFNLDARFFVAHPLATNLLCGALFVILFSPYLWKQLWGHSKVIRKRMWICVIGGIAIVYAGMYSPLVYSNRGWGADAIRCGLADSWEFGLAFGALPVVTIGIVSLSGFLTRDRSSATYVVWRVSWRFWCLLALGIGLGFALVARLGFAKLAKDGENLIMSTPIDSLTIAHASNGALLAFSLWLAFWLVSRCLLPVNNA